MNYFEKFKYGKLPKEWQKRVESFASIAKKRKSIGSGLVGFADCTEMKLV